MNASVFDLDDTLYPERQYAESGLCAVGAFLERRFGARGIGEELVRVLSSGARHDVFDRVLPTFGLSPELIPELVARYRAHEPTISLYADARACLERARTFGPTALITDGPAVCQHRKIVALGVEALVDLVIVTDDAGRDSWKPSPWAYERVMERTGVPADRCCYVGDNPEKDFVAPNRLGWWTVRVQRPDRLYERPEPRPEQRAELVVEGLDLLFRGRWRRMGAPR